MAIPSFRNTGNFEQDVPTENGSSILVKNGDAVVGTYYDSFLATNANFIKTADYLNETGTIVYTYSESKGNVVLLDTAPAPSTAGNVGDIYFDGTTLLLLNSIAEEDGSAAAETMAVATNAGVTAKKNVVPESFYITSGSLRGPDTDQNDGTGLIDWSVTVAAETLAIAAGAGQLAKPVVTPGSFAITAGAPPAEQSPDIDQNDGTGFLRWAVPVTAEALAIATNAGQLAHGDVASGTFYITNVTQRGPDVDQLDGTGLIEWDMTVATENLVVGTGAGQLANTNIVPGTFYVDDGGGDEGPDVDNLDGTGTVTCTPAKVVTVTYATGVVATDLVDATYVVKYHHTPKTALVTYATGEIATSAVGNGNYDVDYDYTASATITYATGAVATTEVANGNYTVAYDYTASILLTYITGNVATSGLANGNYTVAYDYSGTNYGWLTGTMTPYRTAI